MLLLVLLLHVFGCCTIPWGLLSWYRGISLYLRLLNLLLRRSRSRVQQFHFLEASSTVVCYCSSELLSPAPPSETLQLLFHCKFNQSSSSGYCCSPACMPFCRDCYWLLQHATFRRRSPSQTLHQQPTMRRNAVAAALPPGAALGYLSQLPTLFVNPRFLHSVTICWSYANMGC